MRPLWPFRRHASPPADDRPDATRDDHAWASLPALGPTSGDIELTAPTRGFVGSLPSRAGTALALAPLGHDVRLEAPSGIASGIARVVQASPVGRALDLLPRRRPRLGQLARSMSSPLSGPEPLERPDEVEPGEEAAIVGGVPKAETAGETAGAGTPPSVQRAMTSTSLPPNAKGRALSMTDTTAPERVQDARPAQPDEPHADLVEQAAPAAGEIEAPSAPTVGLSPGRVLPVVAPRPAESRPLLVAPSPLEPTPRAASPESAPSSLARSVLEPSAAPPSDRPLAVVRRTRLGPPLPRGTVAPGAAPQSTLSRQPLAADEPGLSVREASRSAESNREPTPGEAAAEAMASSDEAPTEFMADAPEWVSKPAPMESVTSTPTSVSPTPEAEGSARPAQQADELLTLAPAPTAPTRQRGAASVGSTNIPAPLVGSAPLARRPSSNDEDETRTSGTDTPDRDGDPSPPSAPIAQTRNVAHRADPGSAGELRAEEQTPQRSFVANDVAATVATAAANEPLAAPATSERAASETITQPTGSAPLVAARTIGIQRAHRVAPDASDAHAHNEVSPPRDTRASGQFGALAPLAALPEPTSAASARPTVKLAPLAAVALSTTQTRNAAAFAAQPPLPALQLARTPTPSGDPAAGPGEQSLLLARAVTDGEPSLSIDPAPDAPAVQRAPAAAAAPAGAAQSPEGLDELAGRLYDRIRRRFRDELLIDRERAGLVTDIR